MSSCAPSHPELTSEGSPGVLEADLNAFLLDTSEDAPASAPGPNPIPAQPAEYALDGADNLIDDRFTPPLPSPRPPSTYPDSDASGEEPAELKGEFAVKLNQIREKHVDWPPIQTIVPIPENREQLYTGRPPQISDETRFMLQSFTSPQASLAAAVATFEENEPGSADQQPSLTFIRVMLQRSQEREVVSQLMTFGIESLIEAATWDNCIIELEDVHNRMKTVLMERESISKTQHDEMEAFGTELNQAKQNSMRDLETALTFSTEARDRLDTVQAELDAEINEVKSQQHSKRDISGLPRVVLKRIVMFLKPKEFVTCFRVCKRWRQTLDVGYLWKTVFAQSVRHLKLRLLRLEEERRARQDFEAAIPKSATVSLEGINPKKAKQGISKTEVYEMCLNQVRRKAEVAKSDHDDYTHRVHLHHEVCAFLEQSIKDARGQYGDALASRTMAENRLSVLRRKKADIARAVAELEEALREQNEIQAQAQSKLELSLTDVENRLRILTEGNRVTDDMKDYGGARRASSVGSDGDRPEIALPGAQLVEMLVEQRKQLIKDVKSLNVEIKQGNLLVNALSEALRKLGAEPPPAPVFEGI